MSTAPKRNFTAKIARPVLDTSSLYGMDEVPDSGATTAAAPIVRDSVPVKASGDEWVQFSTYLRRNTYLRLKQAEYWEPGFVVRQQIEKVVGELLDKLESANRDLPDEQYQKLLQKNKKLKP